MLDLLKNGETIVEADIGDELARRPLLVLLIESIREVNKLVVVDELRQAVLLGELDDLLVRRHLRREDALELVSWCVCGGSLLDRRLLLQLLLRILRHDGSTERYLRGCQLGLLLHGTLHGLLHGTDREVLL